MFRLFSRAALLPFLVLAALPAGLHAQPAAPEPPAPPASPSASPSRWHPALHLGLETGGDRVVQFKYEDGSTPTIIAGGGLLLLGGASYTAWRGHGHALDLQAQTGIKWRTIPAATNQSANWLRIPVEGIAFWRTPGHLRVGAGATAHLHNVLAASGEVLNSRVAFATATGGVLQAEYAPREYAVGLRYTALHYRVREGGSGTLNASSIGAGFTYFFPTTRTRTR